MKVLVVLARVPYPLEKGDKLRSFHQIRCLSANNEIYLFCLTHSSVNQSILSFLKPYCKSIKVVPIRKWEVFIHVVFSFFQFKPFQIGYFFSKRAKRCYKAYEELIKPDHIYCQFVRTAALVLDSTVPKTIDYQDALSKNVERRMRKSPFYIRPLLWYEYKVLARYETFVFDYFDTHTIISEADKMWINHPLRDTIFVIPNGVDFDFYKPLPDTQKKYDIVFTGNMQYPPNINAALFLVNKVMPLLWEENPSYNVLIAGADPNHRIKKLSSEKVTISGWVDDIRTCYASGRIFVAPMQIGSGLQNKMLEAMAMQIPCVTSFLVNQALEAENGKDLLLANNQNDYAKEIKRLLTNETFAKQIGLNGYSFVKRKYNWDIFTDQLNSIFLIQNKNNRKS